MQVKLEDMEVMLTQDYKLDNAGKLAQSLADTAGQYAYQNYANESITKFML